MAHPYSPPWDLVDRLKGAGIREARRHGNDIAIDAFRRLRDGLEKCGRDPLSS
jgi:predicted HTH domain antitoxin